MPQLIPIGIGAVSGFLSNRKGARTATSKSTTTPTWGQDFQPLLTDVIGGLRQRMLNPAAGTEPLRIGMKDSVNARYASLPDRIATGLARRGFGRSGQLGAGLKGAEIARYRDLGNVDTNMADLILQREDRGLSLAEQLLGLVRGSSSEGQQVLPGVGGLGGAIMGGLQGGLSGGLFDKLLKGGGGGGGTPGTTDLGGYFGGFGF